MLHTLQKYNNYVATRKNVAGTYTRYEIPSYTYYYFIHITYEYTIYVYYYIPTRMHVPTYIVILYYYIHIKYENEFIR